jgi:SPX domain protein involved in polyphosphate accumulation
MKFGKWLKSHKIPEWEQSYLDYDKLKKLIAQLEDTHLMLPQTNGGKGWTLIDVWLFAFKTTCDVV